MKELRTDLDDLCDYQAKHADAPAWFQMIESLSRWGRETESFHRFQNTLILASPPLGEEDKVKDEVPTWRRRCRTLTAQATRPNHQ
jgi:hypothetical protein